MTPLLLIVLCAGWATIGFVLGRRERRLRKRPRVSRERNRVWGVTDPQVGDPLAVPPRMDLTDPTLPPVRAGRYRPRHSVSEQFTALVGSGWSTGEQRALREPFAADRGSSTTRAVGYLLLVFLTAAAAGVWLGVWIR